MTTESQTGVAGLVKELRGLDFGRPPPSSIEEAASALLSLDERVKDETDKRRKVEYERDGLVERLAELQAENGRLEAANTRAAYFFLAYFGGTTPDVPASWSDSQAYAVYRELLAALGDSQ